jgi:16S rRNA (uracil1498-N3)-methyltransferase
MGSLDVPSAGSLVVVVGPEGGLSDDEVARFEAAGAHAVRLGSEVLRTSTAGVAAVAALLSRTGRWR